MILSWGARRRKRGSGSAVARGQKRDRVTVRGISEVDDLYGIIVRLRYGRRQYAFPLCDLEATDERSPNHQIVQDYAVWFANR